MGRAPDQQNIRLGPKFPDLYGLSSIRLSKKIYRPEIIYSEEASTSARKLGIHDLEFDISRSQVNLVFTRFMSFFSFY